jgi:hypothetical protein
MEAMEVMEGAMKCMMEKRMSLSRKREREPRFARAEQKIYAKNKRRYKIKQQEFRSEVIT